MIRSVYQLNYSFIWVLVEFTLVRRRVIIYLDNGHRNAGSVGYVFSWPGCMSQRLLFVQKHHSDFAASPVAGLFPTSSPGKFPFTRSGL